MWLLNWIRDKTNTKPKVTAETITVTPTQELNFTELDKYYSDKFNDIPLIGPRIFDNDYRDFSDLDVAKVALVEYIKEKITAEWKSASSGNRQPNYQPILVTAYQINRDLEDEKIKDNDYHDYIKVNRSTRNIPEQDYLHLKGRYKTNFAYEYPLRNAYNGNTLIDIPNKLKAGTFFGFFLGTTSSLHKAIFNLFKQCTPNEPQHTKTSTKNSQY